MNHNLIFHLQYNIVEYIIYYLSNFSLENIKQLGYELFDGDIECSHCKLNVGPFKLLVTNLNYCMVCFDDIKNPQTKIIIGLRKDYELIALENYLSIYTTRVASDFELNTKTQPIIQRFLKDKFVEYFLKQINSEDNDISHYDPMISVVLETISDTILGRKTEIIERVTIKRFPDLNYQPNFIYNSHTNYDIIFSKVII